MISLEEAQTRVIAGISPTGTEVVALAQACGRVVAADLRANFTQPPADLSAMDGYALQGGAEPGSQFLVVGAAPAGHPFEGTLAPGEAVRIFTGGVVPAGADTILIQENATSLPGDLIAVTEFAPPGKHIRRRGFDFNQGEPVIPAGTKLTPRHIALAAAANLPWITVYRRPRVAILATGDEIALPGQPVVPGGIFGGNGPALQALAQSCGAEAVLLPATPDNESQITALIRSLAGFDVILTIGGASVGAPDLMRDALAAAGMTLDFWKIAMRPGKPLIHGRLQQKSVVGVPGNPVAALLCSGLFLRPLINVLQSLPPDFLPTEPAILGRDLPANDLRQDFLRASLTPSPSGPVATAFAQQDSAGQATLAQAEALILRAPHAPAAPAGSAVGIIRPQAIGL